MYVWYKNAKTCYAYLADVEPTDKLIPELSHLPRSNESFKKSKWFTRGWTLQELIAPAKVEFYARDWVPFGTKSDLELHSAISEVTGIDEVMLTGGRNLREVSIAKKMSWASKRVTTRTEILRIASSGSLALICHCFTEKERGHSSDSGRNHEKLR